MNFNIVILGYEFGDSISSDLCLLNFFPFSGQLSGRMEEKELIGLLEQISGAMSQQQSKVKFDRRRAALDSDSDWKRDKETWKRITDNLAYVRPKVKWGLRSEVLTLDFVIFANF